MDREYVSTVMLTFQWHLWYGNNQSQVMLNTSLHMQIKCAENRFILTFAQNSFVSHCLMLICQWFLHCNFMQFYSKYLHSCIHSKEKIQFTKDQNNLSPFIKKVHIHQFQQDRKLCVDSDQSGWYEVSQFLGKKFRAFDSWRSPMVLDLLWLCIHFSTKRSSSHHRSK